MKKGVRRFFKYARDRHAIYLARLDGARKPWTSDKILQEYRFTNVFRELDKTTAWFRKYVRDPMKKRPEVLLATVVFRLLNRIEVGEAIFCQRELATKGTAFDEFLRTGKAGVLRGAIRQYVGERGPYVTGAYIISSPKGYTKLDGMMKVIGEFHSDSGWRGIADTMLREKRGTLFGAWSWFRLQPFLGNFHSYEIVTDLRHTDLLKSASDKMTWCNVGPGARRGLNRVMGRDLKDHSTSTNQMLTEMKDILWVANHMNQLDENLWPVDWPRWEMREVEHTLCEFDKYERVRLGEGRPRGVFR